jgi:hypothetical protein
MTTKDINPLSLYIPRVYNESHKKTSCLTLTEFIKSKFNELNIGNVSKVDFIPIKNSKNTYNFSKAFVHFEFWYDTPESIEIQEQIKNYSNSDSMSDDCIRVNYDTDESHYWIIKPNKSTKSRSKTHDIEILEKQIADLNIAVSSYKDLVVSLNKKIDNIDSNKIEEPLPKRKKI